jgi:hypothetical protein
MCHVPAIAEYSYAQEYVQTYAPTCRRAGMHADAPLHTCVYARPYTRHMTTAMRSVRTLHTPGASRSTAATAFTVPCAHIPAPTRILCTLAHISMRAHVYTYSYRHKPPEADLYTRIYAQTSLCQQAWMPARLRDCIKAWIAVCAFATNARQLAALHFV